MTERRKRRRERMRRGREQRRRDSWGGGGGGEERQKASYLVVHTTWPAEQSEKGYKSNDLKAEKQLFLKLSSVQFCGFRQKQSRKT